MKLDLQRQKTKPAVSVVSRKLGIATKKLDKLVDSEEEEEESDSYSESSCESGDPLDTLQ